MSVRFPPHARGVLCPAPQQPWEVGTISVHFTGWRLKLRDFKPLSEGLATIDG